MRSFRRTTATVAVALATLGLAACSSSTSSSVSSAVSSAANALEQAKADACGKLADAQTAVDAAKAGNGEDLASTAASLATDAQNLANTLKTVGATDAANDVQSLATDLHSLATATPDQVAALASDAQEKVSSAETALSCPAASMSASPSATS